MNNINNIKKQIIYRLKYSGTKETDLIYQKTIINNINKLSFNELQKLLNIFTEISDLDIFLILTKKKNPGKEYKVLFDKLLK